MMAQLRMAVAVAVAMLVALPVLAVALGLGDVLALPVVAVALGVMEVATLPVVAMALGLEVVVTAKERCKTCYAWSILLASIYRPISHCFLFYCLVAGTPPHLHRYRSDRSEFRFWSSWSDWRPAFFLH